MLTDIIESWAVVEPAAAPRIALGWELKEKVGDELDEAMLLFLEDTMPTIAGLWEKSIDDTQDGIAEGLIQSVCREHGPVGHA